MIKGDIFITSDKNLIMNSFGYNTLCITGDSDSVQDLVRFYNANMASVLLPNYDAVMMELDGNIEGFVNSYYSQLYNPESLEFIALILYAIYSGKNVILYIPKEESDMKYVYYLVEFFKIHYGILLGTIPNSSAVDSNYFQKIFDTIFMCNFIDHEIYLYNRITPFTENDGMIVMKLMQILLPYEVHSLYEGIIYLNKIFSIKKNTNTMPIIPF